MLLARYIRLKKTRIMANKITDMSKIRKVIKFHCNGKSKLFISNFLSLSRNTIKKYISLFEVLGLSFEVINKKQMPN